MLKPLKGLSKAVSITAKVTAGTYAVAIPVGLVAAIENMAVTDPNNTFMISDLLILATLPVQLIAMLLLLVLFLVWVHRLSTNLHAASNAPMQFSANWAVICFFVPIYNLFKPPVMVSELWAIAHGSNTRSDKIVQWWWITWIMGGVLGRMADRNLVGSPLAEGGLATLSSVAALVATVLMVLMVDRLSAAYERNFGASSMHPRVATPAMQPSSPHPATASAGWQTESVVEQYGASPAASYTEPAAVYAPAAAEVPPTPEPMPTVEPGWYPDPSGRHQHRWWDGLTWTRSVANDGVPSLDMA